MWLAAQHQLLLEIIERPDDDQLRLVLADRLNETGDPLGELISVQLSLERMLAGRGQGDFKALKARERALVREHGPKWHQQAAPFARRLVMKRGLPHTLHCSANALLDDGGLTVLAPIQQLELEHVDAEQLQALFSLPLVRRVRGLGLPDLRGLSRLRRSPGPLPRSITKLQLPIDELSSLEAAVSIGLLDPVAELELGARWLLPGGSDVLLPPAAPSLSRLTFTGLPSRLDRNLEEAWMPALVRQLEARPGLSLVWRGIEYDASNADRMFITLGDELLDDPVALPPERFNKRPFGTRDEGERLDRAGVVELTRRADGSLVAGLKHSFEELSFDGLVQLQLPKHPRVLEAMAYDEYSQRLSYEAWPFTALSQATLPLPAGVALKVVEGIAEGLVQLRSGLRAQGVPRWPQHLSRDDVLIGADGWVKLLPPFVHAVRVDGTQEWREHLLGIRLDVDLEGTDDGLLGLLGSALMHLLCGELVSRRLRPSALAAELSPLDPLVEGCLSAKRAVLFPDVGAFLGALRALPQLATQETVARAVLPKQS